MKRHRDAETGEFVTEEYALAHPGTTVSEEVLDDGGREKQIRTLELKLAASQSLGDGYRDRVAQIEAELERLRG